MLNDRKLLKKLVGLGRLELPTRGLGNRCSIHLSYRPVRFYCSTSCRPQRTALLRHGLLGGTVGRGGVTIPGSDCPLRSSLVIRKFFKIVGQYSFTMLLTALKPMRMPNRVNVFPAVRSPSGKRPSRTPSPVACEHHVTSAGQGRRLAPPLTPASRCPMVFRTASGNRHLPPALEDFRFGGIPCH